MGRIRMHGQGSNTSTPPRGSSLLPAGPPFGGGHFVLENLSRLPGLLHCVFGRSGGLSRPPYDSLNTSYSVGDCPEDVSRNLSVIRSAAGADRLVFMNQVHGSSVHRVDGDRSACAAEPPQADALITCVPRTAILAKLADCQGIILYDPERAVTAVVHCGWRGQVADLAGRVVEIMVREFGCRPESLHAAVSPSLGPCCAEFITHEEIFPPHFRRFIVRSNHFDLWELSRFQLRQAGVPAGNISVAGVCTKCRPDLFFSYRAERVTGRFCVVAMLR